MRRPNAPMPAARAIARGRRGCGRCNTALSRCPATWRGRYWRRGDRRGDRRRGAGRTFFHEHLGGGIVSILVLMAAGIPLYICATASVPIAAGLIHLGASPGAALAFLIVGAATNPAAVTTVWKCWAAARRSSTLSRWRISALLCGLALDGLSHLLGRLAAAGCRDVGGGSRLRRPRGRTFRHLARKFVPLCCWPCCWDRGCRFAARSRLRRRRCPRSRVMRLRLPASARASIDKKLLRLRNRKPERAIRRAARRASRDCAAPAKNCSCTICRRRRQSDTLPCVRTLKDYITKRNSCPAARTRFSRPQDQG